MCSLELCPSHPAPGTDSTSLEVLVKKLPSVLRYTSELMSPFGYAQGETEKP